MPSRAVIPSKTYTAYTAASVVTLGKLWLSLPPFGTQIRCGGDSNKQSRCDQQA